MTTAKIMPKNTRSITLSLGIIAVAVGLAYAPAPGIEQDLVVISGTELQEPLTQLADAFEAEYPRINLDLVFQGSQDMVNRYIDQTNDRDPAILIPANGELLQELEERWTAQNSQPAFHAPPEAIAKTQLVAVAWPERSEVLFPSGAFDWPPLEAALEQGQWSQLGGDPAWGSIDLLITDPSRSNSSQLALTLWTQNKLGTSITTPSQLNRPEVPELLGLIKRSVYQPPRSTDILLQEFIARGPNDADVALVYESIALHRWEQSSISKGEAYQIYSLDPTIETVSTAAIVTQNIPRSTAAAAQTFLDFLTEPQQQAVFIQYGFRPADGTIDVQSVADSPWSKSIPGANINPPSPRPMPEQSVLAEIVRLWQRSP